MNGDSKLRQLRTAVVLGCCALIVACGTSKKELLAMDKSQLQLRSIQTRAFDTTDRERTLRTIIATMQDLGFVVDDANLALGSVTATKLDNFQLRMTATVRPRGTKQLLVRASMQFNLVQVDDPEPYQQFFTALGRAMFLEAQQVPEGAPLAVRSGTSPRAHVAAEKMEDEQSRQAKVEQPAQAALSRPRSATPVTPTLGEWLMGEWVGTREGTWGRWDATIRITSYNQATHAFDGDGYFERSDSDKSPAPAKINLVVTAVIDEKGRVVMTTDHKWGGQSFTFNLKRTRHDRLSGQTEYGLPRLSLEKR